MAKLHLYLTNRPLGAKVEVPPYGLFENGKTYDIKDPKLEEDIELGSPSDLEHIPKFEFDEGDPNPGADQEARSEPELTGNTLPSPVKTQPGAGSAESEKSAPSVPTATEKPKEAS